MYKSIHHICKHQAYVIVTIIAAYLSDLSNIHKALTISIEQQSSQLSEMQF